MLRQENSAAVNCRIHIKRQSSDLSCSAASFGEHVLGSSSTDLTRHAHIGSIAATREAANSNELAIAKLGRQSHPPTSAIWIYTKASTIDSFQRPNIQKLLS